MTIKTFEVAGVSTLNGKTKVRFANDYVGRFKILIKNNHEDIRLIELGSKLTKAEICKVLLAHPDFQDEIAQDAIAEFVVRNVKEIKTEQPVEAEAELA
jgi:dUTPase